MATSSRPTTVLSHRPATFFQSATPVQVRCRCGTRIPVGGAVFGVTTISRHSEDLFRNQAFCSVRCVQAFCLESLELLESLDTPASKAVVTDLHELHRDVVMALAGLSGS